MFVCFLFLPIWMFLFLHLFPNFSVIQGALCEETFCVLLVTVTALSFLSCICHSRLLNHLRCVFVCVKNTTCQILRMRIENDNSLFMPFYFYMPSGWGDLSRASNSNEHLLVERSDLRMWLVWLLDEVQMTLNCLVGFFVERSLCVCWSKTENVIGTVPACWSDVAPDWLLSLTHRYLLVNPQISKHKLKEEEDAEWDRGRLVVLWAGTKQRYEKQTSVCELCNCQRGVGTQNPEQKMSHQVFTSIDYSPFYTSNLENTCSHSC